MSKFSKPAVIYCDGRLYRIRPDQWRRLSLLIKGLFDEELHRVGRTFLVQEGIIK
jgi:uncharacterized protein YjeT (DUF2065 family)